MTNIRSAAGDTHLAKFVQRPHDLRVPSEIDCGID